MQRPGGTAVSVALPFGAADDVTDALVSGVIVVGSGGVREHAAPSAGTIITKAAKNLGNRRQSIVGATLSGLARERPFFFKGTK